MRLTRFGLQGLLFHLVLVGGFFAAPYSNLFFLLLGFLTLLGAGGVAGAVRNLRGVEASLGEMAPVPSEVAPEIPVELRAPGRARFRVAVRVRLAGNRWLAGCVDVLEGRATLLLRSSPLPRGCHAVERAVLESGHPFGFVTRRRALRAPGELVVYPAPRRFLDGRDASERLDELLGPTDPAVADLQPASLRDHREGDGVRAVHWRASARRGRLVVREWEGGGGHGFEVVLDRRCGPDELEEALATVSAVVQRARRDDSTLRLHTQGLSATYGGGRVPWDEALRLLAGADALPADAPPPPPASESAVRLPRTGVPAAEGGTVAPSGTGTR